LNIYTHIDKQNSADRIYEIILNGKLKSGTHSGTNTK